MEIEVSLVGTIPRAAAPSVISRLADYTGQHGQQSGAPLHRVERYYRSKLPAAARGLESLRLLIDNDDKEGSKGATTRLRTESVDRLTIPRGSAPRRHGWLQARRVALAPVSDAASADHFLQSQGFTLEFECLRKGTVFSKGATTVSVFELCKHEGDDAWEALDAEVLLVEAVVSGETLTALAAEADDLADALAALPHVSIEAASALSMG